MKPFRVKLKDGARYFWAFVWARNEINARVKALRQNKRAGECLDVKPIAGRAAERFEAMA